MSIKSLRKVRSNKSRASVNVKKKQSSELVVAKKVRVARREPKKRKRKTYSLTSIFHF